MRKNEIKNVMDEIKKWEEKSRQKDLVYNTNKNIDDFQQYEARRSFGDSIYNDKISIDEADIDQTSSKDFSYRSGPKTGDSKNKKDTYKTAYALYEGRELILNVFRSEIFPIKTQEKGLRKA